MKRVRVMAAVGLTVVVGAAWVVWAVRVDPRKTPAFREQFIRDFKRTALNTTPGDAMMLRILVEARGAKRGVEVGSATGFGAINMGIAFERTGGHLYTLEIDPKMVRACRENLQKVGLEDVVTVVEGDALQTLPTIEGPIDFVFIDALKSDYFKYFKLLEPKLKPGAVIVADNVIRSARAMKDFLDFIQNSPDYDTVIIRASMEKGDGMSISYKIRCSDASTPEKTSTYDSQESRSAICSASLVQECPDLARVVEAWPTLPRHIRQAILALVCTAAEQAGNSPSAGPAD